MGLSKLTPGYRNTAIFVLVGLIAFAVTLYFTAPGWMTNDSGLQLDQARRFEFKDDHPVLTALIWHFVDRVVPGPIGMLVLFVALYWTGMTALFAGLEGPLWARVVGVLAAGWYPPAFAVVPAIWKDNLMQGALLVGAACFAVAAGRHWLRWSIGALAFIIAVCARHNAAAAVWPFVMIPLLALPALQRFNTPLRWCLAAALSLALTLTGTLAAHRALDPLATKTEFWQTIPVFDLAGMSLAQGEVLVDPETGVLTPGMGLREIAYKYSPSYNNQLYYCLPFAGKRCVPLFRRTLDPVRLERLRENWWRAIRQHPGAYLEHRRKVVSALLGISAPAKMVFAAYGEPLTPFARDYMPPPRTMRLLAWFDSQVAAPWFRPWVYVVLSLLLVPLAVMRRARGGSVLPVCFLLSGLSYIASFLLTTGANDFRYTVWTIACCVLSLVTLAVSPPAPRRVEDSAVDDVDDVDDVAPAPSSPQQAT